MPKLAYFSAKDLTLSREEVESILRAHLKEKYPEHAADGIANAEYGYPPERLLTSETRQFVGYRFRVGDQHWNEKAT